jgi:hypothetical protein
VTQRPSSSLGKWSKWSSCRPHSSPVCQTAGEIFERDVAIRYHPLTVQDSHVFGHAETPDFVRDQYACGHCDSSVRLLRGVEDFS